MINDFNNWQNADILNSQKNNINKTKLFIIQNGKFTERIQNWDDSHLVSVVLPKLIMQIEAWDALHLSTMRDVDPLVTNVHKSTEALTWQEKLVQLECKDPLSEIDSFHCVTLSDHFQFNPTVVLMPLPPVQQPLEVSLHNFWTEFSSSYDVRAAKCPPRSLHWISDWSHDWLPPIYRKHLFFSGLITQPEGQGAVQHKNEKV